MSCPLSEDPGSDPGCSAAFFRRCRLLCQNAIRPPSARPAPAAVSTDALVSEPAFAAGAGGEGSAVLGAARAGAVVGEGCSGTPAMVKVYDPETGWPSAETPR